MAGAVSLHGDVRRFPGHEISPIITTSGSLRRMARRPRAKVISTLAVHLRLTDAVDVVLDRIFDGENVSSVIVDALERRVQRRGLTGTGRAR